MALPLRKCAWLATGALMLAATPAVARDGARTSISPYIELDQVVFGDLKNGGDVLTYSVVAAGVDGAIETRRAQAQVAMRYERIIGYDDDVDETDVISGIARGGYAITQGLSIEAGALGARTRTDVRGAVAENFVGNPDNVTQVYSLYAGPSYSDQFGDLTVNGDYRIGYTKVEEEDVVLAGQGQPVDLFDESVSHSASAAIGMQPGTLPIGWSVGAGYDREDADQLDQRFEGKYVRGDVTVPVSPTLALVGGVGYEDIEISERDAVRDGDGVPVVGSDGRLVTDKDSPRLLAYDQDGIIWDAGVLWRPSRRTSVEARVGRRYGSTTYFGNASYRPRENLAFNLAVYDEVTSYGSLLNDNLARLGTSFNTVRNPISGDLSGCAFGESDAFCFNDVLNSANSAAFRSRGVTGSVSAQSGGWELGGALGYSRQKYIAAITGGQGQLNGLVDENYFFVLQAQRALDERSSFGASAYANYIEPGLGGGDVLSVGANAEYNRNIWRGLDALAAVGLDSVNQDDFESQLTASALLGLRYNF